MAQWLLITSVIFLASTLQSMTGFGFAVLAVPLLVPLLPPRDAVALITLLSTVTTVVAWWPIRAETAPGWTWRLFIAGLLGVPLGLGALVSVPAAWLRVGVGLGSLVVASVLLWSQATTASCEPVAGTPPITDQPRRPRWALWVAGLVSGILAGGLGMPGPPIMVLLQLPACRSTRIGPRPWGILR